MKSKNKILLFGVLVTLLCSNTTIKADTKGYWQKNSKGNWTFIQDGNKVRSNWVEYKGAWYYLLSNGEMKEEGWEKISDKWYYFKDGKMLENKLIEYNGTKYYLGKNGDMLVNQKIGNYVIDEVGAVRDLSKYPSDTIGYWKKNDRDKWIFIQNGNKVKSNWVKYQGVWYYLLSNGEMKEDGWEKVSNKWYYFKDGKMLENKLIEYNGTKYYLGKNGDMLVNQEIGNYVIDEVGAVREKNKYSSDTIGYWKKNDRDKWIFIQNGNKVKSNWVKYQEVWYYLLSNGEMKEDGWEKVSNKWYYFKDGKMLENKLIEYNGTKYYLGKNGDMLVNQKIGNYVIDEVGAVRDLSKYPSDTIGYWKKNDRDKWIFIQNGNKVKSNWVKYQGVWYYLLSNGEMKEDGWEKVSNKWYYFKDGKMLENKLIEYNGTKYYLLSNGEMKEEGWEKVSNKWYYFKNGELFENKRIKFLSNIIPGVLKSVKGKGIFPSIAISQACLETGFGNDGLSPAPIYNLFGIKAAVDTPPEKTHTIKTAEYDSEGNKYYIEAKFMKFSGYEEAFEYYSNLFTKTKWLKEYYKNVISAKTPEEAAKALTGTYATDPNYGSKLINIIDNYNLRDLDKQIFQNGVKP